MTAFPNYTQIPRRLSIDAWRLIRAGSLVAAMVVAGLLVAVPDTGLFIMWKVVIPLLPVTFMTAPGIWRNICPLAASNQTPRVLGISKALKPPKWLQEYGYVIAITLFVSFVAARPATSPPRPSAWSSAFPPCSCWPPRPASATSSTPPRWSSGSWSPRPAAPWPNALPPNS